MTKYSFGFFVESKGKLDFSKELDLLYEWYLFLYSWLILIDF